MALPLPKVVSDVGPGGPLITSGQGVNAFNNSLAQANYNAIKAQYAPVNLPADAASKIAYAKLMGPQFIAKLMGNKDVVANSPDLQNPNTTKTLYNAGMGGGAGGGSSTGNALLDLAINNAQGIQSGSTQHNSMLGFLKDKLVGILGGSGSSGSAPAANAMVGNNAPPSGPQPSIGGSGIVGSDGKPDVGQHGALTPVPGNYANFGGAPVPNSQVANTVAGGTHLGFNADGTPVQAGSQVAPTDNNKYAENAGRLAGIEEEGKELGKARGTAISDLGKQYAQDTESLVPLEHLAQIAQSPVFMNMRKDIPFFQGLQLDTLSKIGNPEQQKVVGDLMNSTANAVASTVNSFKGRAMQKEFDFANTMKVNKSDTLGVILGKLESAITYKKATMQRNQVARSLMENQHMNEGDAYAAANKQVDMKGIRDNISSQLQSPIRIKNKKTGESKLVTVKEYNEMLHGK